METPLWMRDDRGGDGLEPDLMLPEQFFTALRRSSAQNGERRLMAAVLQEGIETFQKYAGARDPEGRELFEDARAWIVARHDQDLFSFTTVCAVLELDADCLRGGLLGWLGGRNTAVRPAVAERATCEASAVADRGHADRTSAQSASA
ncbi:MAG TPA: hypothetical protein VFD92_28310 [Candidatus Binatia bacterium]|nr:hypothetical protein [Candidatus Binatia bacterium]